MKVPKVGALVVAAFVACMGGAHVPAQAQDYPSRPRVTMVVPFTRRGAPRPTSCARLLGKELGKRARANLLWSRTVRVAGTNIGSHSVAKKRPGTCAPPIQATNAATTSAPTFGTFIHCYLFDRYCDPAMPASRTTFPQRTISDLHELLELIDAAVLQRQKSVLQRLLLHLRHRQHGGDLGVELVENGPRRLRRRSDRLPDTASKPARRLRRAAECRETTDAASGRDAERPHALGLEQAGRGTEIGEHHRDVAGDEVVERRQAAAIGTCNAFIPVMLMNNSMNR